MFFLGAVGAILTLGAVATYTGQMLASSLPAFSLGFALLSLIAGLAAIFSPAIRRHVTISGKLARGGVAGALAYGALYSLTNLTTTAGPLMLLLATVAAVRSPAYSIAISLSYGVGRAAPFLMVGLFTTKLAGRLAQAHRTRRLAELAAGVMLLVAALYFASISVVA